MDDPLSHNTAWDDLYKITNEEKDILLIIIQISEPMPSESRQIRIYIKPTDEHLKDVSITTLADFFQHIQTILYQVCDEVVENECRRTGRYPNFIKENCNLILKSVTLNSADIAVGLSQSQTALPFPDIDKTIGEQAIVKTNDIFEIVREKENIFPDLSPVIANENRRYHILSEIDAIWPDELSKYNFQIGIGGRKLQKMSPKRKPVIRRALERETTQSERRVTGRLVELNVTKKHSCQIETPEGKIDCIYTSELEDIVKNNTGGFVSVSGRSKDSHTIFIESEFSIKRINNIPLKQVKIDDRLLDLKKEIDLNINYDRQTSRYLVNNDQLNIFSINVDLRSAVENIQEQIGMLWSGYVKEDISNLTESAIKFREMLKKMIEG